MKSGFLAAILLLTATAASATDGPYSHTSNGVTQPIIQWDASGTNITYIECVPGSRCVNKTSAATLSPTDIQSMSFFLKTGSDWGQNGHFAFGVRGNPTNANCTLPANVRSMPFLGRGFIIYPAEGVVKFENFTLNCIGGSGVPESTSRSIVFRKNSTYLIQVHANDQNVWYEIEKYYYNYADGIWDFMPIAYGDCLSQASAADDFKCAKRPDDLSSAQRTFIANTVDSYWTVSNWTIY